jgi:hypothetical protein
MEDDQTLSRAGTEVDRDVTVEDEVPVPHAEERIRLLEEEIARLREANSWAASRPGLLGSNPGESDRDVLVHFRKEMRYIPLTAKQGWASLRKRLIRVFKLKRSRWELRGRKIGTDGDGGWTVVEPPLRVICEDMEYRVVIKQWKEKIPGVKGGTTHGKPRKEWRLRKQRQGGPATTTTGKRPEGRPPEPTKGIEVERAVRKEVLSIERNEGKKPVTTSQATTQQKGTTSRDGWVWTADPEVVSDEVTGAREKCLTPPAEDRPQDKSTCEGKSGNGDKAATPIPRVGVPETKKPLVIPVDPCTKKPLVIPVDPNCPPLRDDQKWVVAWPASVEIDARRLNRDVIWPSPPSTDWVQETSYERTREELLLHYPAEWRHVDFRFRRARRTERVSIMRGGRRVGYD